MHTDFVVGKIIAGEPGFVRSVKKKSSIKFSYHWNSEGVREKRAKLERGNILALVAICEMA